MAKIKRASPLAPVTPTAPPSDEVVYLKAKVERVLFLLDLSVMPAEVKNSWITLLPDMALEQVDRLASLLEEELLLAAEYAKQNPEDEELLLKLKLAKEHYSTKIALADKQAMQALAAIEAALPQE